MSHDFLVFLANTGICVFIGGPYLWFRWWLHKRHDRIRREYESRTKAFIKQ